MTYRKTPHPISPAGYEAIGRFIEQALAHERDPLHHPTPAPDLLLIEPTHGPITAVALVTIDGEPQVSASFHNRNPRFFDPLDYAAQARGLAFGMGMSLNHNGKGLAYPRMRVQGQPGGRSTSFAS